MFDVWCLCVVMKNLLEVKVQHKAGTRLGSGLKAQAWTQIFTMKGKAWARANQFKGGSNKLFFLARTPSQRLKSDIYAKFGAKKNLYTSKTQLKVFLGKLIVWENPSFKVVRLEVGSLGSYERQIWARLSKLVHEKLGSFHLVLSSLQQLPRRHAASPKKFCPQTLLIVSANSKMDTAFFCIESLVPKMTALT